MKTPSKEKQKMDDALKSIIAKEASNKLQLIHSTRMNYVSKLSYFTSLRVNGRPLGWFCLMLEKKSKAVEPFKKTWVYLSK